MKRMIHTLLLTIALATLARAQEPVAPCTDWLATVDEATQHIVLSWRPSPDTATLGYHICTGTPCLDYDTVFGRLDTTYVALDHSPLEAHTYRLHVFDTAYNVSSLTERFGNMVLHASQPECESTVVASWSPYRGMPGGVAEYSLMMRLEPVDDDYRQYYRTDSSGTASFSYELPSWVTRVHVKVQARNRSGSLVSQSNVVSFERQTVDTAAFLEITHVAYDSLAGGVHMAFNIDTAYHSAYHYTLWRSIDHRPWAVIDTGVWGSYTDRDINLFDSLYCYQLSVFDACGINEKFSPTACTVVPDPPQPEVFIPNIIILGDATNGSFLPLATGLAGDIYELTIYDRNGLQVFATTDPAEAWTPSSGFPQGAYVYVLRVRFATGIVQSYVGSVILVS